MLPFRLRRHTADRRRRREDSPQNRHQYTADQRDTQRHRGMRSSSRRALDRQRNAAVTQRGAQRDRHASRSHQRNQAVGELAASLRMDEESISAWSPDASDDGAT